MNVQKHSENTLDGSNSSPPRPQSQTKNHEKAPMSSASTLLKSRIPVDTDRPLTEVISEPFMAFDHRAAVVDPFARERARDAKFEQELGTMLLDLILETHAWSSARPKYESQMAMKKLEQKVTCVVETEKEQGIFLPSSNSRPSLSKSHSSLSFASSESSESSRSVMSLLMEKTRNNLNEFVTRMRTALAALAGL